ncbi:SDR family oxidoreductase [Actinobacteria bacterium YIM 96077]|uniref:Oxidoreductase n=1 Tax=Phytoactinopolyspora halophila TaxID=1981511 RepID=A0A329QPT9_9ACTN|nr:SDR family oxidoreductase [Phytoactinopolyspora halophila]AYY15048.1 SDR family oxidoreductase [Actinobacteria bacterium YIM 96077]RAW14186.1 oxidoreductase [Phytoactinopolyspora halophila]
MDFSGRTAIVTGSGAGIGRETALLLASHGANVVVNSRNGAGRGQATVDEIVASGGRAAYAPGDVAEPATAAGAVEMAVTEFGGLDILVNNAGLTIPGTVETTSEDDVQRMLDVNVTSTILMSRAAMPALRARGGGTIVNVASVAGIKGHQDRAVYSATKGAIVALSRSMAVDHVPDGIRVNCVCPGTTLTPAIEEKINSSPDPDAAERAFVHRQPMGRLGLPREIAHTIAHVASAEAAFMTGSVVVIDGGMTM